MSKRSFTHVQTFEEISLKLCSNRKKSGKYVEANLYRLML